MLQALEKALLKSIKSGLGGGIKTQAGPAFPPSSRTRKMVAVAAISIELPELAYQNQEESGRTPAYRVSRVSFTGDGSELNFTLPASIKGDVTEVETPTGRVARPGDDYLVVERTIKFFRAPDGDIRVHLRGERAEGYYEQKPGQIKLELDCWAKKADDADQLARVALEKTLAFFVGLDVVSIVDEDNSSLLLRLIKSQLYIAGMKRETAKSGRARYIRVITTLNLIGVLDLLIMLGEPQPESQIREIHYASESR